MLGLTVHNFLSAATGLAMAFALVRGFTRSSATTVGNFWVDMTRVTLYILLPISFILAFVFVALGMPQTLAGAVDATTLEGAKQTISIGPVASQEIIKELGTNGGGFFNANAAHPFENPNAWTNMLEIWALLLIPVASVLAFGRVVGDIRQGRAILAAMAVFLIVGVGVAYWSEIVGNPLLTALGVDPSAGNLEGKEVRFGQAMSVLYATATSGTSTGAVNTMHDSLTPLAGMVPMFNLLAGCIWPGGVGAGLYGFLVVAIIAVFVAGLMVGRTPEYLGKKIEVREMKLAMLAVLIYPLIVLGFSGASVLLQTALDSMNNSGPHGLSEILYAYASANANNGSAFAGLNGNTLWFNTTLGLAMLLGRFAYVIPVLALAGSLAAKKKIPTSAGTFPTDGPLFVGLLVGVIVILYLLQYFPALSLGPVVEHYLMLGGKTF
jgi:potassium-transporting ATPase potassium-binding subunit